MATIEEDLQKIELLKPDLTAVLEKEEGHWETPEWTSAHARIADINRTTAHCPSSARAEYEKNKVWRVDKPAVPDETMRDLAKTELDLYCEHTTSFSVKYAAGKALRKNLRDEVPTWLSNLEDNLQKTTLEVKDELLGMHGEKPVFEKKYSDAPDMKTRQKALQEVVQLFKLARQQALHYGGCEHYQSKDDYELYKGTKMLLEKVYTNDESREHRLVAAEALGYSRVRIFCHENPITAKLIGAAIASGTALGIAYAVMNDF